MSLTVTLTAAAGSRKDVLVAVLNIATSSVFVFTVYLCTYTTPVQSAFSVLSYPVAASVAVRREMR